MHFRNEGWYVATKHALEGLSDCLRLELKPFGINVVVIQAGNVESEFFNVTLEPTYQRSKGGPYEERVNKMMDAIAHQYATDVSPPSVIADVVSKAVILKNPKRRYVAGKNAFLFMWLRSWLGDHVLDTLFHNLIE